MKTWKAFKTYNTTSVGDLSAVADDVLGLLQTRTILLLEGPVGAGKTELVKVLSRKLGLEDPSSPSYAIHYHYENASSGVEMDHVDLYRLESADDLESTGFWDLFQQSKGLIIIEWPERLDEELLPLNWFLLKIVMTKKIHPSERSLELFTN